MVVRVLAVYPLNVSELDGLPGVRQRRRGDHTCTQVECDLVTDGDATTAVPRHRPPAGTPGPVFRIQVESERLPSSENGSMVAIIEPLEKRAPADPEQRLAAPFFNNGQKIIFEFQRGEVLHVTRAGGIEMRFVAIEAETSRVGTIERFHLQANYLPLLARCVAHLEGTAEMFPVQARVPRPSVPVPAGPANLNFGRQGPAAAPRVGATASGALRGSQTAGPTVRPPDVAENNSG